MDTLVKAGLFCMFAAWCAQASVRNTSPQEAPAQQAADAITVPDGTRLELRFTQPLRGPITDFPWTEDLDAAQPNDRVRLVAAQNLLVDNRVVIARGAIGQATVTRSYVPYRNPKYPDIDTGLDIRLDWIEAATGERIGLRAFSKGKPKAFHLMVLSVNTGHLAKPETTRHDLIRAMTLQMGTVREDMKKRDWLPAGTRIVAFVQGPVNLNRSDVEEAQAQFPTPDAHALLTVYRAKDKHKDRSGVSCDGEQVTQLGSRQYVILELEPGLHSCRVGAEKPVQLTAKPGEDYFMQVRHRFLAEGWELKLVSTGEGEDGISVAEMVQR